MPVNIGLVEILLILIPLAFVGGAVYKVGKRLIHSGQGRESRHLQTDQYLVHELEDVQRRLLDLEERMDSTERLVAHERHQLLHRSGD